MPTQRTPEKVQTSVDSPSKVEPSTIGSSRWTSLAKPLNGSHPKAGVSLTLIVLLANSVNWPQIALSLAAADKQYIAAAFALLFLVPLMVAERWRNTALASDIGLSRGFFLRATYAAVFVGQFLPAGIGVDAVRLGLLWKKKLALQPAVQSIAVDRIIGISSILALMLVGMPFAMYRLPPSALLPTALIAILLVCSFALLLFLDVLPLPKWLRRGWVNRLLSVLPPARAALKTPQVALALGYGVGLHALSILAVLFLARAFGYSLAYQDLLTVVSFTIFTALLPISFNGWGVREGAMVVALSLLAVTREAALMISFLFGIGSAIASLPGSVSWHNLDSRKEQS